MGSGVVCLTQWIRPSLVNLVKRRQKSSNNKKGKKKQNAIKDSKLHNTTRSFYSIERGERNDGGKFSHSTTVS